MKNTTTMKTYLNNCKIEIEKLYKKLKAPGQLDRIEVGTFWHPELQFNYSMQIQCINRSYPCTVTELNQRLKQNIA